MDTIDAIRINFEPGQLMLLNLCLAFIMFGIALDLTVEDFRRLFKNKKPAAVGLSSQLILLPLLTFCLVMLWPLPASVAMGLILVASCPGGNISNFAVHFAGGNTALSITLTSVVTLAAMIITPVTFSFWTSFIPQTDALMQGIELNPFDMVLSISQLIVAPLILGMFIHHRFPRFAIVVRKPIRSISLFIFVSFIVVALYENWDKLHLYLSLVFLIVLVHNGLALLAGYYYARSWGLSLYDSKAVAMETGIQNSGLGLVLVFLFFNELGGMLLVVAWWGVWDMISALLLSSWWRYRLRTGRKLQTEAGGL